MARRAALASVAIPLAATLWAQREATPVKTPEQRAIDYLAHEVPRWSFENQCFSCHNNGDAARVLYLARRLHRNVPPGAFAGTTVWLTAPVQWDHNRGNPAFSDKKLARIQFAAALTEAWKSGVTRRPWSVSTAARLVASAQSLNGSWPVDADADVGSPVTWGTPLATYMARDVLESVDKNAFSEHIAAATGWFEAYRPQGTFESAVKLMALPKNKSSPTAVDGILAAQSSDGGWGPRLHAPSEPFDTAIVMLALHQPGVRGERVAPAIARGRAYLLSTQERDGGWPETTRPPGGHSYAQHISTSAWATEALLITDRAH